MTNIFMVRLYTSSGVGGTAVFSTLEGAKQLVARLNEHKKFIENHCSYRETAEWLSHHSGRKITGMGLREVLKRKINKGW